MEYALREGGWINNYRFDAIDGSDPKNKFIPLEKFWHKGTSFPGAFIYDEDIPNRITNRGELACLCSWQMLVESLENYDSSCGWFLLMEDDVGSSLATVHNWPVCLNEIIENVPEDALAIQMAPINGNLRSKLHHEWKESRGRTLVVPKNCVKSHGNGAVLLNQSAIPFLKRRLGRIIEKILTNFHFLTHPYKIRPVADKWLYASLPENTCWVSTFPLFCLEAETSSLHQKHINTYHLASREATLQIWREENYTELIEAYRQWKSICY